MAKLNPLFKAQNRAGRRKVLNTLDISARDKNNVLNNMDKSSTNGGGGSKYAPRYFKIDWDKASEDWKYVLSLTKEIDGSNTIALNIASTYKISSVDNICITAYPFVNIEDYTFEFTYIPIYVPKISKNIKTGIYSFEDIIQNLPIIFQELGIISNLNLSMEGITEITEEEYYKID